MARKQVSGQGTLDKFLTPSQEQQVQKQLAKSGRNAPKGSKSRQDLDLSKQGSKQGLPPDSTKQKRSASLEELQVHPKRPRRQMMRLYDDEEPNAENCVDEQIKQSILSCDDSFDFQPARRTKGPKGSKAAGRQAKTSMQQKDRQGRVIDSRAETGKQTDAVPAASFQGFSYSKGDGKQGKQAKATVINDSNDEVSSVQRARRSRSEVAYTGLY